MPYWDNANQMTYVDPNDPYAWLYNLSMQDLHALAAQWGLAQEGVSPPALAGRMSQTTVHPGGQRVRNVPAGHWYNPGIRWDVDPSTPSKPYVEPTWAAPTPGRAIYPGEGGPGRAEMAGPYVNRKKR